MAVATHWPQKGVAIAMLTAYADDSSDGKAEKIFTIAAVIGTQEEWDKLEVAWEARTGGRPFHATDCEAGRGIYKSISRDQNLRLYKDLIILLANSKMLGFGVAIDLDAYRTNIPEALDDAPYFHCFVRVILQCVRWARIIIPQQTVKFTFDINPKTRYNAAFLYDNYLCKRKEYTCYTNYMEKEIYFATSETIGIQVADLYTKEVRQLGERMLFNRRTPMRLSMQALRDTKRFGCDVMGRDYFLDFRQKMKEIETRIGLKHIDYINWLKKERCLDNAENRSRYLIYSEAIMINNLSTDNTD